MSESGLQSKLQSLFVQGVLDAAADWRTKRCCHRYTIADVVFEHIGLWFNSYEHEDESETKVFELVESVCTRLYGEAAELPEVDDDRGSCKKRCKQEC